MVSFEYAVYLMCVTFTVFAVFLGTFREMLFFVVVDKRVLIIWRAGAGVFYCTGWVVIYYLYTLWIFRFLGAYWDWLF